MRTPGNTWESFVYQQLKKVSRSTVSLWNACKDNRLPIQKTQQDFGIDNIDQITSIKWCIDCKKILPQDLEDVKFSGKKLTALIRNSGFPNQITFSTLDELIK